MAYVQARTNSGTGTSTSVTLASAPTSGNLLVFHSFVTAASRPASPGGTWTAASSTSSSGGSARGCATYWKISDGSESGAITSTVTSGNWQTYIIEWDSADSSGTDLGDLVGPLATSTTTRTWSSDTTTSGVALAVGVAFGSDITTSTTAWSAPTIGGTSATMRAAANLNNANGTSSLGCAFTLDLTTTAASYVAAATSPNSGTAGSGGLHVFRLVAAAAQVLPDLVMARYGS